MKSIFGLILIALFVISTISAQRPDDRRGSLRSSQWGKKGYGKGYGCCDDDNGDVDIEINID